MSLTNVQSKRHLFSEDFAFFSLIGSDNVRKREFAEGEKVLARKEKRKDDRAKQGRLFVQEIYSDASVPFMPLKYAHSFE